MLSGGALFVSWKLLQFPSSLIVTVILANFTWASPQPMYYCSQIYAQKLYLLQQQQKKKLMLLKEIYPLRRKNICPTLLTMFMFINEDQFFSASRYPNVFFWSLAKRESESKHTKKCACISTWHAFSTSRHLSRYVKILPMFYVGS